MGLQSFRGLGFAVLGLAVTVGCSSGDDDSGQAGAGSGGKGTQNGGSSGDASGGTDSADNGGTGGGSSGTGGSSNTSGSSGTGGSSDTGGSSNTSGYVGPPARSASAFAQALGRKSNFLIGMGNDLDNDHNKDGAYTLGVTLDLHYAYLVGLPGKGGWPDWNADGSFVNILTDSADAHGTTPMFTLYAMAANGEGNVGALTDKDYMSRYWAGTKLMVQRLGIFDKPAVVHVEPDFWAFFQQQSHGDPTSIKVLIHGLASDCEDEPEDLTGYGHCMVKLARLYSPKTLVGFHASTWAGNAADIPTFLNACGAGDSDFIAIDMLDRDAGCFEAAVDPACMRGGTFYWDESNETSPNFHEFLDFSKTVSDGLDKPIVWWQIPFGVPSDTPGGTAGHYRDNRVHYLFSHVQEFVDAGGVGAVFGTGAGNQTFITTDGDQFKDAVTKYLAKPTPL